MRPYFIKIPKIVRSIFKSYLWSVPTNNKEIYLTFDDGPTPIITPWVLDTLDNYNAKATFFCVGENIRKYPNIFSKVVHQKHAIGNHTFNHLNGWKSNSEKYIANINKAEDLIKIELKDSTEVSNRLTTNLFRPPYGKIKRVQAKNLMELGYKIIMWDVLSGDFDQKISQKKCLENVINSASNGSIIVFHDSKKSFETLQYILPKTLEYFSEKGFVFKSL